MTKTGYPDRPRSRVSFVFASHFPAGGWTFLAAVLMSAMAATDWYTFRPRIGLPGDTWLNLFLLELPVWLSWALVSPLILRMCQRFPLAGGRLLPHVAAHFAAAVPVVGLCIGLMTLGRRPLLPFDDDSFVTTWRHYFAGLFGKDCLLYFSIASALQGAEHARKASRLQARLAESRLERLEHQLRPHFLFNALHALSALIARDPTRAQAMLNRLSSLLRTSLDSSAPPFVSLDTELGWLDEYIQIQQMRYQDRLEVWVGADSEARNALVPRFVLQPLVENAIRHVLERREEGLRLRVSARYVRDHLEVEILDDGPGFPPSPVFGTGLRNLEERLHAVYGDEASLEIGSHVEGGGVCRLVLPHLSPIPAGAGARGTLALKVVGEP